MKISKRMARASRRESEAFPDHLVPQPIPAGLAAANPHKTGSLPLQAWRSRLFLVVLWIEPKGARRLSVMRTEFDRNGVQLDGREIRDIALALARLNHALKTAGFGPAVCIGLPVADLRVLAVLPKSLDYMTVEQREQPGPIRIAGVRFIAYERPTEAPPP